MNSHKSSFSIVLKKKSILGHQNEIISKSLGKILNQINRNVDYE